MGMPSWIGASRVTSPGGTAAGAELRAAGSRRAASRNGFAEKIHDFDDGMAEPPRTVLDRRPPFGATGEVVHCGRLDSLEIYIKICAMHACPWPVAKGFARPGGIRASRAPRKGSGREPSLPTSTLCRPWGLAASPGACRIVPGCKRETPEREDRKCTTER